MENIYFEKDFLLTSYDGMYFTSPFKTLSGTQGISSCEAMRTATTGKASSCSSPRIVVFRSKQQMHLGNDSSPGSYSLWAQIQFASQ